MVLLLVFMQLTRDLFAIAKFLLYYNQQFFIRDWRKMIIFIFVQK